MIQHKHSITNSHSFQYTLYMKLLRNLTTSATISFLFSALLLFIPNMLVSQNEISSDTVNADPVPGAVKAGRYPSLMWEITGPGLKKPSYLYGSMHVSRRVAFHLGDTFFLAIKGVDVVALESNPGEWMENYTTSPFYHKMIVSNSNHLNSYRYRNFYRSLFYPDLPEVKTFAELLSKKYNVMNHMLYRKNDALSDFEEKTYLDLFIFQAGSKHGKTIIGLEDFEVSRQMVQEAETPPRKGERVKKKVTREQSKVRSNYGELIEDAYRKGDLDLLDSLSRMMDPYPKYHTYMIVKRNEVMANTIDSVIRSGNAIFAACGAAHLPGDSGVIEMLIRMGYQVRPITRTINKSQNKQKDKIDEKFVKQPFSTWTSPEGDFSVELPGQLFSSVLFSEHGEYFYPDMVNGSYYVVNRFSTFAPFRNHTVEDVKARFDSLIYEFIPGKINHFREITVDGYPAYEIRATINRGDMQLYRIVFTPMEVFVFKVSGPSKYIRKDKSARRFINSVKFNMPQPGSWQPFKSDHGIISLDLPSYRIADTTLLFSGSSKDLVIQAYDPADQSYYMLTKGAFYDFGYIEEDTFELNFMAEQFAEQFELKLFDKSSKLVTGYPALEFSMTNDDSTTFYKACIAIAGPAYYLLLTNSRDEAQQRRFLTSFAVNQPRYDTSDFFLHTDTTMLFTVMTPCNPPEDEESEYYYFGYDDDEDKEDLSHMGEQSDTYFFNYRTVELITVEYEKFHKYSHFATLEKLWASELEDINSDSSFILRRKILSDSGLVNTCYVEYTDTNSSRTIITKLIQKHGAIYRLSTVSDTVNGPSEFVTKFFDTFSPQKDTLVGWLVFADKGTMYLQDLIAEDSTTRAQAKQSIAVSFDDHHAPLLMERISNPRWAEHSFAFRKGLISELMGLKNKDIPSFLQTQYERITDTVTLQLAILQALAGHHTDSAARAFLHCLKTDLPLTSTNYSIDYIFNVFRDSLQIARMLYPEIFAYTRYREYEDEIYYTLSVLLDSNLIAGKDYKGEYDMIYRNARDAWKRHLAREEEEMDKKSEYYSGGYSYSTFGGSYNYRLLPYMRLLFPFWDQKPEVRKLAEQLLRSQTTNLRVDMTALMLSRKMPVADSIIRQLSCDPFSMFLFYRELSDLKIPQYFDSTALNQQIFAQSILMKEGNLKLKDTLIFLDKKYVSNLKGEGYVYFFKKKKENDKNWNLCWVGIMPADSSKVICKDYVKDSYGSRIYDNDDLDELMEKEMKKIRLLGRERAERMSFDKDNYYYLFY